MSDEVSSHMPSEAYTGLHGHDEDSHQMVIPQFVCSTCNLVLESIKDLARHSNMHDDRKPFVCQQCGFSTPIIRSLENHLRVHSGYVAMTCSVCLDAHNPVLG